MSDFRPELRLSIRQQKGGLMISENMRKELKELQKLEGKGMMLF